MEDNDFFDVDALLDEPTLVRATSGQRLVNYVIDHVVISVIVMLFTGRLLQILLGQNEVDNINPLVDYVIFDICAALIYFVVESMTNGKTLGKYITRTRVVTSSGGRPTAGHYLGRSFARVVPFNAFSFLNDQASGWHDKWSDTMVIDELKSDLRH